MRTIRTDNSPLGKLLKRTAVQPVSLHSMNYAALGHTTPGKGTISRKATKTTDNTIIPFVEGKSEVDGDATVI